MASKRKQTEKTQEAAKRLQGVDFPKLSRIFADMLDSYANFAISIGSIQKENQDQFQALMELTELTPKIMEYYVENATKEEMEALFKVFVKMPAVLSKLNRLMELNPDEKIEVGEDLRDIAAVFRREEAKRP